MLKNIMSDCQDHRGKTKMSQWRPQPNRDNITVLNGETAKRYEKSQQPVSRPRFETDTFRTRL